MVARYQGTEPDISPHYRFDYNTQQQDPVPGVAGSEKVPDTLAPYIRQVIDGEITGLVEIHRREQRINIGHFRRAVEAGHRRHRAGVFFDIHQR